MVPLTQGLVPGLGKPGKSVLEGVGATYSQQTRCLHGTRGFSSALMSGYFLLQGIFPTQRSNTGLLHCKQILYQLSYKASYLLMGRVYSLPGNCLTWGHLGSASPMVVLMETSKRVATKRDLSTAAASAPVPVVSPCGSTTPHLPQETLQHEQVVWIVSCGVTAPFLWGLVCANFCLCPPRLESVSPSPMEVL